jgi:hypothetical protein
MARQIIAEAIAEFRDESVPWIFESTRNPGRPFDSKALGHALLRSQRCAPKGKKRKTADAQLRHGGAWDFQDAEGKRNPFTPHDLRRTASSILEMRGHSEAVRGAIMNHAPSRSVTARHYWQGDLLRLKRSALLDLEKVIPQIIAGGDPFARSVEDDREEERRVLGLDQSSVTNVVALGRT